MTTSVSIETFEPYFEQPRVNADGMQVWMCMDDRPPAVEDTVVGDTTYYGIPGGVYGIAIDLAVATEIKRAGRFINKNQGVHILAKSIHSILRTEHILAMLHEICAAEEGAPDIGRNMSIIDPEIFEGAVLLNPEIAESDYERTVDITGRIMSGNCIAEPRIVGPYLRTASEDGKESAISSASLKQMQHGSLGFLAVWEKYKVFNTRVADADNRRAYVISMGAMGLVHNALRFDYPVELKDLQVATAVRTATIRAKHLLDSDGKPLPAVNDLQIKA